MDFTGERYVPNLDSPEISYEHWHRYLYTTQFVEGKIVLDIACGEGYGSDLLAKTAQKVVGVDISGEVILNARETYKRDNLEFLAGSVANIPIEGEGIFDVIVSFETIEHVGEEDQKKFLKEVKRLLKPNGVFICSTPDKEAYSDLPNYKNEFHVKEFYKEEYSGFLKSYFKNVELLGQKIFNSSNIWDLKGKNENFEEYFLEYFENGFIPSSRNRDILYLVSISSDGPLPLSKASFLTDLSDRRVVIRDGLIARYKGKSENLEIELAESRGLLENEKLNNNDKSDLIEELKEEIIEGNKERQKLVEIVKERDEKMEELRGLLEERSEKVKELSSVVEERSERVKELSSVLEESDEKIAKLEVVIGERDFKIQELDRIFDEKGRLAVDLEKTIVDIKSSFSYKLGRFLTWPLRLLIPVGSKRECFLIVILNSLKHPVASIKKFKFSEFLRFLTALQQERSSVVASNVKNWLGTSVIKPIQVNSLSFCQVTEDDLNSPIEFKKYKDPLVSIVIPVYNQWKYTYSCLLSILNNTVDISYEIIIADDNSSDTTKLAKNILKNVKIIRNKENLGFLKNCNYAAKVANGRYVLFLNNDTNVQKNWLSALIDLIEGDERVGMVGSKLIFADGKLQEAGGVVWNDASGANYGRLDNPDNPEYCYVKESDYISGACIMIRKKLWHKIGGFDERYSPAYYEDTDLAFAVRKEGYKVLFQPKSVVVHFEGISHGTDENVGIKSYQKKNKEKFLEKWEKILTKEQCFPGQDLFLARDRSRNKKTILFIEHIIPTYDRDAGSRSSFLYLKLLVKNGFNVKFMADDFTRREPYCEVLEGFGIEVLYGDYYKNNWEKWLVDNDKYIDYVWLNKPQFAIKYIDFVKENLKAKVVYYGHDLHYLREMRRCECEGDENIVGVEKIKKLESEIIKMSDVVYYPSTFEVDEVKKNFPKVNVKLIPVFFYEKIMLNKYNFKSRNGLVFVGGFLHQPNVDAMLWFLKQVWPLIVRELGDIQLRIVGSNIPESLRVFSAQGVCFYESVSDDQLTKLYNQSRIAIAPLRYGAGAKGKVIEAMYRGIPIVTTSIGAEGLGDVDDVLITADYPSSFARSVIDLYRDEVMAIGLVNNGTNYIKKYYSEEAAKAALSDLISF